MKTAASDAMLDAAPRQSQGRQLNTRNDSVLTSRQRPRTCVGADRRSLS
jgi:hypothetical protein